MSKYSFSLLFLLSYKLKNVPVNMLQPLLNIALNKMFKKYPNVFKKLEEQNCKSFLIKPTDLPFNFILYVSSLNPSLVLLNKNEIVEADASVTASMETLLKMFEGKLDGDAAFFSKDLIIEGSTACIVALRNIIDAENINIINDLTEDLGIFSKLSNKLARKSTAIYNHLNYNLNDLKNTFLDETDTKLNKTLKDVSRLKKELENLKKSFAK